jgi:tyrosine ammonia-lyase
MVTVGDIARPIGLDDVDAVATGAARVELHPDAVRRAAASEAILARLVADRRAIYGVTTGYGPLADRQIDPAQGALLQRKLVYHLATGVGAPLPPTEARAIVMARLATLSQGRSAVRPQLLEWLCACLNSGLAPIIPEKGTVGASGDLTPAKGRSHARSRGTR